MKKMIIVIGGGFAGIQFIKKIDDTLFDVLLIDKINHHQFQPLFYQVATSQLEPASISFPLRNVFKSKKNLQIRLAEVHSIDSVNNKIETTIGEFFYDYLVIAIGCTTNFFGNDEIRSHAFTLKTTYDAINIRNHILQTFEDIISAEASDREGLLNLTIVGAGPTGVELAGAFAEIKNNILPKDYPDIDFTHFKISLIEGSKDTLNSMSISAKRTSKKYLQKMGVNIITETFVKRYDGNLLELSNGNIIKSKTVIWAAGVIGNTIKGLPENVQAVANRIEVNRTNLVEGTKNIFAIGDIALMKTPKYPKGHPQVANVAINQAKNLAFNLNKAKTNEFEYKDLGSMATIGRNKAVVDLPHFKFKGYFAWLVWMFLHLMLILSVRNKLIIFINWVWAYLTKDTSLRLILKQTKIKMD
ncbi:MAG: NAD(P)/FAD-dependent oxidoreductase [Saprospiraceae bacterium]|nr:NAD(P)/FAD-dependent oxidoreductase [Saprospiraceae bacterium]MBK8243636.1 NAD(P)/FAD-dependent oxidoreductase [Candidatus Defluviibacterium haderslevense]